jgi:RNA polymerase sigma-70 factor (ECF subfamily)
VSLPATSSLPVADRAEHVLVDAAIGGDAAAFAALYDRHLDRVYRHCYYRTANRADAEDLAQQTFLQAWKAIRRYRRGTAPFIAWLLTISQHLATSHHRKRRVVRGPVALSVVDPTLDPDHVVAQSVATDGVRRAILRLRPERQVVIILRYIEGFSVSEVAAALGKTDNHVRVIQHRALGDLRRILAEPATDQQWGDHSLLRRFRDAVASALHHHAGRQPAASD